MENFTVQEGLNIQAVQLLEWQSILKPEKFATLKAHCEEMNKKPMKTGNDVFRGVNIDNWIGNNLIEKQNYKNVYTNS